MREKLASAFSREFSEGCYSGKDVFNRKEAKGKSDVIRTEYRVNIKNIKLEEIKSNLHIPEVKARLSEEKRLLVRVYNKQDAISAAKNGADIVYMDLFDKNFVEVKNLIDKPLYGVTPRIMFDSDKDVILNEIKQKNPAGLLAGNLGILNMELKIPIHLDYNCNCFNDLDVDYFEKLNGLPVISPELSVKEQCEFKDRNFISFVHGKIRLMTLAHNIPTENITDEKGFSFKIDKIRNGVEISNEKELGLFNKIKPLIKSGINCIFIDTDKNVSEIVSIYRKILDGQTVDVKNLKNEYVLGWSEKGII
jgi:hypothetical protein